MKFKANAKALAATISTIVNTVPRRNTIPILENIVLTVDGGTLEIQASNLEIWSSITMAVESELDGQTTVGGHTFLNIVKNLPATDTDMFTFEVIDDRDARVTFKRSRYKIVTLPVADWPAKSEEQFQTSFTLPAEDAHTLFKKCAFAMCNEEARFYLNGVYFCAQSIKNLAHGETRLCGVATNGHQLAAIAVPLPDGAEDMTAVIIPRQTVDFFIPILAAQKDMVSFLVNERSVCLEAGAARITSLLVDGKFPEFERILPRDDTPPMTFDTGQIQSTSKRLAGILTKGSSAIAIDIDGDQATLSTRDQDTGNEAVDSVDITDVGNPIKVGFNGKYLAETLGAIDTDTTDFHIENASSPALFRPHGNQDMQFVIMPMRV